MEKFSKKQPISSLKERDFVDDLFVVKIKKGVTPYVKGFAFTLLLSDSSGRTLAYKYWGGAVEEEVKKLYDSIKEDSVLKIQGVVSVYSGKLQLTTNPPNTVTVLQSEQYDVADFVKPAKRDVNEMYDELTAYVDKVSDEKLKAFLLKTVNEPNFKQKFKVHPGAIEIHHNWIGGLLEHTLQILAYCKLSSDFFPDLDKDLLIAGAILHDIGKMDEIEVTSRIKGTVEGQLIGHTTLGALTLHDLLKDTDIDKTFQTKLIHMIVSHLGKMEFGAGKTPMFSEAVVLHYADELSAKTAEITEYIKEKKEETEDDFMYHWRERKNIYLK